jgi:hypothetical protein
LHAPAAVREFRDVVLFPGALILLGNAVTLSDHYHT